MSELLTDSNTIESQDSMESFGNERYDQLARDNGIEISEPSNEIESNETQVIDEPKGEDLQNNSSDETLKQNESSNTSIESKEDENNFKDLPKGFKKQLSRKGRTIDRMKKEIEELKAQMQSGLGERNNNQPVQEEKPKEYTRDDFVSEDDFIEYRASLKADKFYKEHVAQQTAVTQQQEQMKAGIKSWNDKIESNFKTDELKADFKDAVETLGNPAKLFREDLTQYIFSHPQGPKLLKYFADRPSAIQKVNQMHAYDLGATLQKVVNFIQHESQPVEKPKQQSVPNQPVGGLTSNSPGRNTRSVEDMSDEELLKAYRNGKL